MPTTDEPETKRRPKRVPPDGVRGNSKAARRWRRTYHEIIDDWSFGNAPPGPDRAVLRLIARATSLTVASEQMDQRIADGLSVDTNALVKLSGQLSRTMRALGLELKINVDDAPKGKGLQQMIAEAVADGMDVSPEALAKLTPPERERRVAKVARVKAWEERDEENERRAAAGEELLPRMPYPWGAQWDDPDYDPKPFYPADRKDEVSAPEQTRRKREDA